MYKIEENIQVTRYVAFDGTKFDTEAECQHYEGSAFGMIMQQLEGCTLDHYRSDSGHQCYTLVPKTRHDIYLLGQILKMAGNEQPCGDMYERLTLLTVRLHCNTVTRADVTNLEDYIMDISNGQFTVVSTIKQPVEKEPVKS